MGRTLATANQIILDEQTAFAEFRRALRREDQRAFDALFAAARKHKVNPHLIAAVIRAESAFNPRALSPKGARGLMQLMPATAKRYGVRTAELFQPERNIEAGVRYLSFLTDRFAGDLPRILAGYNAGEGSVDRYGGVPPYRETQGYVRRILGYLGLETATVASLRR